MRTRRIWLFDVDGTLVPPGGVAPDEFVAQLAPFMREQDVRIVSGGTFGRISHQLGATLTPLLTKAYCCLGNSTWIAGVEQSRRALPEIDALMQESQALARNSKFGAPQGPQVVLKEGMLSIIPCGVSASRLDMECYSRWDAVHRERLQIAQLLREKFPNLEISVSGRASVDVAPPGGTKAQVISDLLGPVTFFADSIFPGGNDESLAAALVARQDGSKIVPVSSWKHCMASLAVLAPRLKPAVRRGLPAPTSPKHSRHAKPLLALTS